MKDVLQTSKTDNLPKIPKQNYAMKPFRTPPGVTGDDGKPIDNPLLLNHVGAYDDHTDLVTTVFTRSQKTPKGEPNTQVADTLFDPKKPFHPQGKGQYSAELSKNYKTDTKIIIEEKNKNIKKIFEKKPTNIKSTTR